MGLQAWNNRNNPKAWHNNFEVYEAMKNTSKSYQSCHDVSGFQTPVSDKPEDIQPPFWLKGEPTVVIPVTQRGFYWADKWTKNYPNLVTIPCLFGSHFTILIRYKNRDIFLNSFGASESQALTPSSKRTNNYNKKGYQEDGWHCGDWVVLFHEVAIEAMEKGELETISADELAKRADARAKEYGGMHNVRKIVTIRALQESEWDQIGEENIRSYLGHLSKYFPRLNQPLSHRTRPVNPETRAAAKTNSEELLEVVKSERLDHSSSVRPKTAAKTNSEELLEVVKSERLPLPSAQKSSNTPSRKQTVKTETKLKPISFKEANEILYSDILPLLTKNIRKAIATKHVDFKTVVAFYKKACLGILDVLKRLNSPENDILIARLKQILEIINGKKIDKNAFAKISICFLEVLKRYQNRYNNDTRQGIKLSAYYNVCDQTLRLYELFSIKTIHAKSKSYKNNDIHTLVNTLANENESLQKKNSESQVTKENTYEDNTKTDSKNPSKETSTSFNDSGFNIISKILGLKVTINRLFSSDAAKKQPNEHNYIADLLRKSEIKKNTEVLNELLERLEKNLDNLLNIPERSYNGASHNFFKPRTQISKCIDDLLTIQNQINIALKDSNKITESFVNDMKNSTHNLINLIEKIIPDFNKYKDNSYATKESETISTLSM